MTTSVTGSVRLGRTGRDIHPLVLGGNVFGWTADERTSHAVLDAYTAAGGDMIDTADVYTAPKRGGQGGESESVIGTWLASRRHREEVLIATKVGAMPGLTGLSRRNIVRAAEESLRRLRTDRIDLYYAHLDDPATPVEETLLAFDDLVRQGKVRWTGASNFTPERLAESVRTAEALGVTGYSVLQPHYNLVERAAYETGLADACERHGLAALPYFALAQGFLTGKYRRPGDGGDGVRAPGARAYLHPRGLEVLDSLDRVADRHGSTPAAVALRWLRTRPGVAAPVASARTVEQLQPLLASASLELDAEDLALLERASAWSARDQAAAEYRQGGVRA